MAEKKEAVLGIDIGGSKLVVGLVGTDGTVLARQKASWDKLDADSVIRTVVEVSDALLQNAQGVRVGAIGVNIPGLADAEAGLWLEACFSGIRNIPIAEILKRRFGLPVFIDNDVNNCAIAEKVFGVCRECTDFVWLTVSNGCGGALYLHDDVYHGVMNTAGEFGHIIVEERGGYPCGCGNSGCLEAQAAGPGIVRRFLDAGGPEQVDGYPVGAKEIAGLARAGDERATEIFRREGYYIGKALAAVINAIAPQKAIIGGGVAEAIDLFMPELLRTIDRMTYRKASGHTVIEKTGLGYDAALVGAASLAMSKGR